MKSNPIGGSLKSVCACGPAAGTAAAPSGNALDISTRSQDEEGTLPTWTFNLLSPRDGNQYSGTLVGHSPFRDPQTDRIRTYLIPLVIRTHRIGIAFAPRTFHLITVAGDVVSDPTAPDNTCLAPPNNVPVDLIRQSPLFQPARFVVAGTDVGTTQYVDAFQRANFWNALGADKDAYHLLLDPVVITDPVVIDVPSNEGVTITDASLYAKLFGLHVCTPITRVNGSWLDGYLTNTVLPALAKQGVGPDSIPIFITYNAYFKSFDVTYPGLSYDGYHAFTGHPSGFSLQAYIVSAVESFGLFQAPPDGITEVLSHELGEWANDPYPSTPTPPWGNTGQVVACQSNLEVGDPLSFTTLPLVPMPNGHAYDLQELAFFSWFYGGPSLGAGGWYSNGGTFLTDAGHVCP